MKNSKLLFIIAVSVLLLSCGSNAGRHETSATADSTASAESSSSDYKMEQAKMVAPPAPPASSSAAVVNTKDSVHKFVRTADLKFKVKDVFNATQTIENITTQMDGFVTYTKLNRNIDNQTTTRISADSSLVTTYYTMVNDITLRVPNSKLDTALKAIAALIDFLDYRTIKADDVALQIIANKMERKRASESAQRLRDAIDNRGRKLPETTDAEDLLSGKQEQRDNATLADLSLQDQINYSTVHLSIYQRQTIKREVIPNDKNINEYTPGFARQLLDAFKTGWSILETIIVFIVNIWAVILFIAVVVFLYKRYGNKWKKK